MSAIVCRFDDLAANSATRFVIGTTPVAVVRIGDDVYAIGDTCTHGEVSLSQGEVMCDDLELECWKHGSAFSLITGEPQTLPAIQAVPVFVVKVIDGDVVVSVEAESTEVVS